MTSLSRLLAIRPSESRLAGLVLGTMLVTAAGSAMGSAGIETLFFTRFGVQFLPYMYMLLGVLTMVISLGVTAWFAHLPAQRLYVSLPLALALVLLLGRLLLLLDLPLIYPLLWLGKEVVNTLTGMLVWGAASTACDARQARRLFPLFSAGRILGTVVGGVLTGWSVSLVGTENLLLPWIGAMLLAFLFSRLLLGAQQGPVEGLRRGSQPGAAFLHQVRRGFQYIRASPLLRWISIASILFSILYFSLALPFSRAAASQFPDEAQLAGFLGAFQGLSTAAAFLVSLLLANRLFSRFGIMSMLLVFAGIYLLGFGFMTMAPVFAVIAVFRFVQTLWLSGIADPAYQAMFNVIPPERRDQVRYFTGGVPEQAGTFLAGLVLLVGEQAFSPSQLALLGLLTAAGCMYVIWQARRAYNLALVDALRLGRPQVFFSEEEPFGGFRREADAMAVVMAGMHSEDRVIRRVSTEILEHVRMPEAAALLEALEDPDPYVRLHALRGLGGSPAERVMPLLLDPDPDVRLEAVRCLMHLSTPPEGLRARLEPMLAEAEARLRAQAAACLLKFGAHPEATQLLRSMVSSGDEEARVEALAVLPEDFELAASQLSHAHASVRRAAVAAIRRLDASRALPVLVPLLGDPDLRDQAASELGAMGEEAREPLLAALRTPELEAGALKALRRLPAERLEPVEGFAGSAVARALHYDALMHAIAPQGPRQLLLRDVLREKAHTHAAHAIQAVGLLSDPQTVSIALESLAGGDAAQRAHALETLESLRASAIIRPLFILWDEGARSDTLTGAEPGLPALLDDPDPWVRDCAAFAAAEASPPNGDRSMDTLPTLSLMERLLFFRRVPLFSGLTTLDLKNVAAIAEEMLFEDGTPIALQNEPGHVMHLVIAGEILVITSPPGGSPREIARRGPGDIVGEMALISDQPRMADLIASGDVRTLCIDRRNFHALLRERPEVSLAVMQVLSARIKEMAHGG